MIGTYYLYRKNKFYQKHLRCLYTYTFPGGQYRNRIDYFLILNFIGFDCGRDHTLLLVKITMYIRRENIKNTPSLNTKHMEQFKEKLKHLQANLNNLSQSSQNNFDNHKQAIVTRKQKINNG